MTKLATRFLTSSFLAGALTAPAYAITPVASDNVVLFWQQVLQSTPVGPPPVVARDIAMANVAIHDAVNATVGNTDKSYLGAISNQGGDTRAAASVAAHNVLVQVDPANAATVRRQNIWRNVRRRLAECRARLGVDVRRRACGAASVDVRWFGV